MGLDSGGVYSLELGMLFYLLALGVYGLGVYTLGVYCLSPQISDLAFYLLPLGVQILVVHTLWVYSLEPWISDLEFYLLGLGVYALARWKENPPLGGLLSRATDFGSEILTTRSKSLRSGGLQSTLWVSTFSGYGFRV